MVKSLNWKREEEEGSSSAPYFYIFIFFETEEREKDWGQSWPAIAICKRFGTAVVACSFWTRYVHILMAMWGKNLWCLGLGSPKRFNFGMWAVSQAGSLSECELFLASVRPAPPSICSLSRECLCFFLLVYFLFFERISLCAAIHIASSIFCVSGLCEEEVCVHLIAMWGRISAHFWNLGVGSP